MAQFSPKKAPIYPIPIPEDDDDILCAIQLSGKDVKVKAQGQLCVVDRPCEIITLTQRFGVHCISDMYYFADSQDIINVSTFQAKGPHPFPDELVPALPATSAK